MKKIAIIFGGESSEYSVSLHSAASVIREIDKTIFDVTLIGITKEGVWKKYSGSIEDIDNDTWHLKQCEDVTVKFGNEGGLYTTHKLDVDVVFPVLHGKNGEDGTIQGVLEMAHLKYVGCGVLASAVCLDKEITHIICESIGIKMAKYVAIKKHQQIDIDMLVQTLGFPMFVKPSNVGSSYGISKVKNKNELADAIRFAFEYDTKVLVEKAIEGFEIGCAVLGNHEVIVGEVDEVDTKQEFFDFEGKYQLANTIIHCPARISEALKKQAKENARKIYDVLQCSGLSRVDMFVTKNEELVFNEINTLPGFTSSSRYPTMMKKIGIQFSDLIIKLYDLAIQK